MCLVLCPPPPPKLLLDVAQGCAPGRSFPPRRPAQRASREASGVEEASVPVVDSWEGLLEPFGVSRLTGAHPHPCPEAAIPGFLV